MVELKQEEHRLTALLSGELDHHAAKEMRETIDFAVREALPETLILYFTKVTFMDSSGIGLILGRSHSPHSLIRLWKNSRTCGQRSPKP